MNDVMRAAKGVARKYVEVFALIGLSALALLVYASGAAATTITSPTGTVATPTIKAQSEGHVVLHNENGNIECASTIEGGVESHGIGITALGNISALAFTGCTNGWTVKVDAKGSLEVHWTSGYNGTVTSTGMTVTATLGGIITCRYKTEATHLGTITGGTPATLHLQARIPFHGGSGSCGGETAFLTGSYKVTSPASLFVDNAASAGSNLTSPTGTVATPTIKAKSEGHALLHNESANIKCSSAIEGKVEHHGVQAAVSGLLSSLSFTGCTDGWAVSVIAKGELAVESTTGYNGTVTSNGMTIEAKLFGGLLTCLYKTDSTHLGTITGGSPATLHLEAAVPFHGGSGVCGGETAALTGSYEVTSPESLFVDGVKPVITSPTGASVTSTIKAESESHVVLDHPIAGIECKWSLVGTVEIGSENATIPLSGLTTSSCTNSWHATTVSPGKLEIAPTGGYNGTVTWSGATIEMTRLGTTCRYKTEKTHFGTITGGTPATIHIEANLPFHSGSALCGEEAYPLTGSLKVATPTSLFIDKVS